jgi:dihydropyrimidine dehydrogenase (NAD+) subunit PreT
MPCTNATPGITTGRLSVDEIKDNFKDLHAPLNNHQALVAAERCYFCYDAPCVAVCPTSIDIPLFIRQIATGTPESAAKTIFTQNILGGMCARVCPTEILCEGSCVLEEAEGKPVEIGRLQRYATDCLMGRAEHPFERALSTGKSVAIVGSGPAGLACAHRLAMKGHAVTVFEGRHKGGGLSEFGIAAYKSTDDFAQRELEWLLRLGGITVEFGKWLGKDKTLDGLRQNYDAVFLGIGLGGVNTIHVDGADCESVVDAVKMIADLRQSKDKTDIAIGRRVVVIGGGMTAIDAAVQSKFLGAEDVTIAYRRDKSAMAASECEQNLATSNGVHILFNVQPCKITPTGIVLARTKTADRNLVETGETINLEADQILLAIGQSLDGSPDALELEGRKIKVGNAGQTSIQNVWAGGDCTIGGDDLTVTAAAEGRDAAEDIHETLMG